MKKATLILAFAFLSVVTISYSQVIQFTDRNEWRNVANNICFSEDFESFDTDTSFNTSPLQLNGFSLFQDVGVLVDGFNIVDTSPHVTQATNGTNTAVCFVGFNNSDTQILLEFDSPVRGFFADYISPASGSMLFEFYNNEMGMVDSYLFTNSDESHGFISLDEPITFIRFRENNSSIINGEVFALDNIEIECSIPIPTLSQWGIIALSIIMLIFGLVGLKQRKLIFG